MKIVCVLGVGGVKLTVQLNNTSAHTAGTVKTPRSLDIYIYNYVCECYTEAREPVWPSDESHFNVSVGSEGQSQDSVHKPQPF